jgi:hypothetical protein
VGLIRLGQVSQIKRVEQNIDLLLVTKSRSLSSSTSGLASLSMFGRKAAGYNLYKSTVLHESQKEGRCGFPEKSTSESLSISGSQSKVLLLSFVLLIVPCNIHVNELPSKDANSLLLFKVFFPVIYLQKSTKWIGQLTITEKMVLNGSEVFRFHKFLLLLLAICKVTLILFKFCYFFSKLLKSKLGGLDSREQLRSRSRLSLVLRQAFRNVQIKSLYRDTTETN